MTEREVVAVIVMMSPDLLPNSTCCLQEKLVPIARVAAAGQLQLAAPAGMASAAENFLAHGHALMEAAHTN